MKLDSFLKLCLVAVVLIFGVVLTSCSDEEGATKILTKQGYTNIRTDGHAYMACPKDYNVTTRFYATAPNGQNTKGAVCRGFLFRNSIVSIED